MKAKSFLEKLKKEKKKEIITVNNTKTFWDFGYTKIRKDNYEL